MVIGAILGLIQAVFLICAAQPILSYMGVGSDSAMLNPARQYLTSRALGAPANLLSLGMQEVFRGFKDTKTPLCATGDVNSISVVARTNIHDNSLVHVAKTNLRGKVLPTIISDNVTIGHNAVIQGCTIEDEAFIDMGAILLDGVVVEKHAMVAVGVLVRHYTRNLVGEVQEILIRMLYSCVDLAFLKQSYMIGIVSLLAGVSFYSFHV